MKMYRHNVTMMKKKIANIFNLEISNTNPDKTLMTLLPKSPELIKLREEEEYEE